MGFCALGAAFMWGYHAWWRAKPYSLGTANEALALGSLLGLALLVSAQPLRLPRGLERPLLLAAGLAALLHILTTLLLLREIFTGAYYAQHAALAPLGLASAALWVALGVASAVAAKRPSRGWAPRFCSLGPSALLGLVLLHFLVLGKPAQWLAWAQTLDRPAPPGTCPVSIIAALALVLRAFVPGRDRERASETHARAHAREGAGSP